MIQAFMQNVCYLLLFIVILHNNCFMRSLHNVLVSHNAAPALSLPPEEVDHEEGEEAQQSRRAHERARKHLHPIAGALVHGLALCGAAAEGGTVEAAVVEIGGGGAGSRVGFVEPGAVVGVAAREGVVNVDGHGRQQVGEGQDEEDVKEPALLNQLSASCDVHGKKTLESHPVLVGHRQDVDIMQIYDAAAREQHKIDDLQYISRRQKERIPNDTAKTRKASI